MTRTAWRDDECPDRRNGSSPNPVCSQAPWSTSEMSHRRGPCSFDDDHTVFEHQDVGVLLDGQNVFEERTIITTIPAPLSLSVFIVLRTLWSIGIESRHARTCEAPASSMKVFWANDETVFFNEILDAGPSCFLHEINLRRLVGLRGIRANPNRPCHRPSFPRLVPSEAGTNHEHDGVQPQVLQQPT